MQAPSLCGRGTPGVCPTSRLAPPAPLAAAGGAVQRRASSSRPNSAARPGLAAARRPAPAAATATAAAASGAGEIPVRIVVPECELAFGSGIRAVGDAPALGAWDVDAAPDLVWAPGHTWTADLPLPAGGDVAFKLVLVHGDGAAEWEPGPDRLVRLPSAAALAGAGGGPVEVLCVFGSTGSTGLAATDGPGASAVAAAPAATGSADHTLLPSEAPLETDEEVNEVTPYATPGPDPPSLQTPDEEAQPVAAAAAARAARAAAGAASAVATAEAERAEAEVEARQADEEASRAAAFFASIAGVAGAEVGEGGVVMLSFDDDGGEAEDAAAAAARLLK